LIIPMIIQTILLDPSGAVWTDGASNVSRLDPSGAVWVEAEHPARNRKVEASNPDRPRATARPPEIDRRIVAAIEQRLAVSFAVAARLLPGEAIRNGAGLTEGTRQAGDQDCCGVEVRGFEPLASSVRVSGSLPLCRAPFAQVAAHRQGRS
jgi:hypothetical protein